ncbi:hypothetical protein D4R54_01110 [archaeon]|nr:MAG: hypothetical protein D4R54_01110 [archaeon]
MSRLRTRPLLVHNVAKLVPCTPEVVGSPESKKIGVDVEIPIPSVGSPRAFVGYQREHVEKFFIHRDHHDVVTIVSEDEAKRRGIVLIK